MSTTTNLAELKAAPPRPLADMKPKEQVAYLLNTKRTEIAKMLPKHLSADRLLKVAQIAATTTPALAKCDVASLVGAIGQCAAMGLEPNTVLGHAYLVPFNTKRKDSNGNERWVNSVQVIVGYRGLIDLARRSGQIVSISAHEVCERDHFDFSYGLDERLDHKPALGERGDVVGFYAVAKLKDGGHVIEFMSTLQVQKIRDGSQGYQQAKKYGKDASHPWAAHFVEMGRKTVIRRIAKYLPLSIEFQTAVGLDELAARGADQKLDTIDGEFAMIPEDEAPQGDDVDAPPPPALESRPVQTIQPAPVRQAEPEPAQWAPSPEEEAAIRAAEQTEASAEQPRRRGRPAAGE